MLTCWCMLCRIWGPNEPENTPGSRPLGQLGGEENEQFLPPKKTAKRRRFAKNRDFFSNFQSSPPTFIFVQYYSLIDPKTSDVCN